MLLERDEHLARLAAAVQSAQAGLGQTVIISGEAGAGKSAVMEAFSRQTENARIFWGFSEALFTPRPLGPLRDMAPALDARLGALFEQTTHQEAIFPALLKTLQEGRGVRVLIFEDIHWADNATLDLIKYLGRRIAFIRAVLVLTLRPDELDSDHPMVQVLGDLPATSTHRITLEPLSLAGMAALAKSSVDQVRELHRVTAGNPFFATEVMASGTDVSGRTPISVRDAVWARLQRLTPGERELLETLSVNPGGTEPWLADALLGRSADTAIDQCVARGLLLRDDEARCHFRHEIARTATLERLSPTARAALHRRAFEALSQRPQSQLASLIHHAAGARDASSVLGLAPRAAEEAARLGAHREAARHLATAIAHIRTAPPELAAQLYEDWSYEASLGLTISDELIAASKKAVALWKDLGRADKVAHNLRWLSRLNWLRGDSAAAVDYIEEAIRTLDGAEPSRELAMVYSTRAQLYMFNDRFVEAEAWARKAIALAERLGDTETRIHALNNLAGSMLFAGRAEGKPYMEESLRLALAHGFHDHASRAYINFIEYAVIAKDFVLAERLLGEGLAFNSRYDLDGAIHVLSGRQAQLHLDQGRLQEAATIAAAVFGRKSLAFIARLPALIVLAKARLRLGDSDAHALLEQALGDALATGEQQHIVPTRLAAIEGAWLQGDLTAARHHLVEFAQLHLTGLDGWDLGSFAVWWRRCGMTEPFPGDASRIAAPHADELRGDIGESASAWRALGLPYEAALSLLASPAGLARAVSILEDMAAAPAAAVARRMARDADIRIDLPRTARGPYSKARQHPLGLTGRQAEVFEHLAKGLTNHEIATALHCSARTVEHHVSAILGKLNAGSRIDVMLRLRNEPWLVSPRVQ